MMIFLLVNVSSTTLISLYLITNSNKRLAMVALHYNENKGRKQVKTKEGNNRCAVQYLKYMKGDTLSERAW